MLTVHVFRWGKRIFTWIMASGRRERKRDSDDTDNCVLTVLKEKTGIYIQYTVVVDRCEQGFIVFCHTLYLQYDRTKNVL